MPSVSHKQEIQKKITPRRMVNRLLKTEIRENLKSSQSNTARGYRVARTWAAPLIPGGHEWWGNSGPWCSSPEYSPGERWQSDSPRTESPPPAHTLGRQMGPQEGADLRKDPASTLAFSYKKGAWAHGSTDRKGRKGCKILPCPPLPRECLNIHLKQSSRCGAQARSAGEDDLVRRSRSLFSHSTADKEVFILLLREEKKLIRVCRHDGDQADPRHCRVGSRGQRYGGHVPPRAACEVTPASRCHLLSSPQHYV